LSYSDVTGSDGPFPAYSMIFCRADEHAETRTAAFPDDAEASEHARLRLLRMGDEWISVVLARGANDGLIFLGAWDKDFEGALRWEDASLA